LAAALLAALSAGCWSKAQTRQVVVYCAVDQDLAEPILDEFKKRTGIEVLTRFDTEASKTDTLVQKIEAEAAAPVADVFWSGEIFRTIVLAQEGLLEPYEPSGGAAGGVGDANSIPSRYRDPNGRWHGFALRARAIAYSTQRVPADAVPRGLEDLLDPRWKGRIAMADPRFGTTKGDVASWFAHYGLQTARKFLELLKANGVRPDGGNSTAVVKVANGLADLAMTDSDDVYAAQKKGWPIGMVLLDQGGAGVLTFPHTVAKVKGGPHPQEAAALMDYLLSAAVEERLAASDAHNTPVRPALAKKFGAYAVPKPLDVDYGRIAEQLPAAVKAAEEVFRD
jgi:iron(III) transport system substrate-binding protein